MEKKLEIGYAGKPIPCILKSPSTATTFEPALLFTHGSGGGLQSEGITNFSSGFSQVVPILCFQGNSNLKSRVKMFTAVMDDQGFTSCLGGRSMGARAAIMAAVDTTQHLILVSYPLQSASQVRDKILLDLPASVNVLFVSGDRDSMCDLKELRRVRDRMKCASCIVTVEDADHGMNMKPKSATMPIGRKTGEVAAKWLLDEKTGSREGKIFWSAEDKSAIWSGWLSATESLARPSKKVKVEKGSKETILNANTVDEDNAETGSTRSRKRKARS